MNKPVYSVRAEVSRTLDLDPRVFLQEFNQDVVYYAMNHELANLRLGTAHTKTRSEVTGSNRKPWKQKHTGRARSGDVKSPIWVGGGTVFGPRKRSYRFSLPKKVKKLAFKNVLGLQAKKESFKIVEDFEVESGKTRDLLQILERFFAKQAPLNTHNMDSDKKYGKNSFIYPKTLILLRDEDLLLKRCARNIPWLKFLSYNRLRLHDLFYAQNFLILETALNKIQEAYQ